MDDTNYKPDNTSDDVDPFIGEEDDPVKELGITHDELGAEFNAMDKAETDGDDSVRYSEDIDEDPSA